MQKPEATLVAGYRAWQKNFERHVKKGERGIRILAPTPFTIKEEREKVDPVTREPVVDKDGMPVMEEVDSDNGINHKSKEVFIMVNSISKQEIMDAVEKAKEYFTPILAPKTVGYYKNVWNKLIAYADASPDKSNVDVKAFYGMATHAEAYTRPDTQWLRTQARAVLSLLDIHEGNAPKREYYYKRNVYDGRFLDELNIYLANRTASGKSIETIRCETIHICDFLVFIEKSGISSIADITAQDLLEFLRGLNPDHSDQWKRAHAYTVRRFLNCPELGLVFPYDVDTLLLGYRHIKNQRLESYYTAEEIRAVMDAVDRSTQWGKTIYAMMLLACVYGLRVSDIRVSSLSPYIGRKKRSAFTR